MWPVLRKGLHIVPTIWKTSGIMPVPKKHCPKRKQRLPSHCTHFNRHENTRTNRCQQTEYADCHFDGSIPVCLQSAEKHISCSVHTGGSEGQASRTTRGLRPCSLCGLQFRVQYHPPHSLVLRKMELGINPTLMKSFHKLVPLVPCRQKATSQDQQARCQ